MMMKHTPAHRAALALARRRPPGPGAATRRYDEGEAAAALATLRGKPARHSGPPRVGALALALVKPLLKDQAMTLSELKRRWPEIVGAKLAQLTAPEKLIATPKGATLTVTAAGSAAPFVQHQERLILERCALAGADVVKLQIRQVAATRPAAANVAPLRRGLTPEEERALTCALAPVDDDRLKRALARLGRSVVARA